MSLELLRKDHALSLHGIDAGYWWYQGRVNWAKRLLRPWWETLQAFPTYIDLGCGTGGFAQALQKEFRFAKTLLVDGDRSFLERHTLNSYTDNLFADLSQPLSLPWNADLISCMDVIEHLEDDASLLKQIATQLKPNGRLLLSVPAHPSFYSRWDAVLGHKRRYRRRELKLKLREAGLKPLEFKAMWSFLVPAVPYRKLFGRKYEKCAEFEAVPDFVNRILVKLSDLEWSFQKTVPLPFGTSFIVLAEKI